MSPLRSLVAAVLAAALAGTVAACGGSGDGGGSGDRLTVLASTAWAADIAAEVAGDDAEVEQLVPDGAGPHGYAPSAKDRARIGEAGLVVVFGRNLEAGLPLDAADAPVVELADHVRAPRPAEEGEHAGEEGHAGEEEPAGEEAHGHEPGEADPHVWMDPTQVAAALPALADALAAADPANAAAYRRRARAYAAELRVLDGELRRILAAVPRERRKLITSHDSLGYFAARYGFEVVATPFGISPEAEASAARIAEVAAAVRRERVPVVFAQRGDDPKALRRIAADADVEVVDDLLIESPAPGAETYEEALRHDARLIAEALGP